MLKKALQKECIEIYSKTGTKLDVLKNIAKTAKRSPILEQYSEEDILKELVNRESISSTGFGKGIAIPHCRLEGLDEFVIGIVSYTKGIDFDTLDGKKAYTFIFIIGPSEEKNTYINILSQISKLLKQDEIRSALKNAETPQELVKTILNEAEEEKDYSPVSNNCQFTIVIQDENYFQDILEIFSATPNCSVSVLETNNAGYYLNSLPLFSSYWTDRDKNFDKIILAVVNKNFMNDIIRQVNTLVDDINAKQGVLLTVQDILYSSGSINL